jgi:hypothetical protein
VLRSGHGQASEEIPRPEPARQAHRGHVGGRSSERLAEGTGERRDCLALVKGWHLPAALTCAFVLVTGTACLLGWDRTDSMAERLKRVPLGSDRSQVRDFLQRQEIRDIKLKASMPKAYYVEAPNSIRAVVRGTGQSLFVRTDLVLDFLFDDRDKLTGYRVDKWLTGP